MRVIYSTYGVMLSKIDRQLLRPAHYKLTDLMIYLTKTKSDAAVVKVSLRHDCKACTINML